MLVSRFSHASHILLTSTSAVSGFVETKRVVVISGRHCGDGYVKYRCVASRKESVWEDSASEGSPEVVSEGGFSAPMALRRSCKGSEEAICIS